MELGTDRLGNFKFNTRRVFVALTLIPCVLSAANIYVEWHWFGKYDNHVLIGCFVVLFLVMRYLGPTVRDAKHFRDAKRGSHRPEL